MTIAEITNRVIDELTKDYYLVPRNKEREPFHKLEFINEVVMFVSEFFSLHAPTLKSVNKTREYSYARYIAFHIIQKYSVEPISLDAIGGVFNRDRSTIHYAILKFKDLLEWDWDLKRDLNQCETAYIKHKGK